MTKLKPCPFCGGEAKTIASRDKDCHFVHCRCCYAGTDGFDIEYHAISSWNSRAEPKQNNKKEIVKADD